VSTWLLLP
jgi:hypothetical protein